MKAELNQVLILTGIVALLPVPASGGAEEALSRWSPSALREQFVEANRHYQAGEYGEALARYRGITERVLSREVQFNLGNCYFRLGQPGRACLAYRRALLADPGMVEARQNLRFLQNKLGYLTFQTRGLQQAAARLSARQWAWITAMGGWILAFGVASKLAFRFRQPIGGMVLALAICGGMVALAGTWAASSVRHSLSPGKLAIVVEDGVVALTGPFPDARAVRSLSPGSEVRIEAERHKWLFVYLPDDSAGWVEQDAVEELWPSR